MYPFHAEGRGDTRLCPSSYPAQCTAPQGGRVWDVVDGKQRLATLFAFITGVGGLPFRHVGLEQHSASSCTCSAAAPSPDRGWAAWPRVYGQGMTRHAVLAVTLP